MMGLDSVCTEEATKPARFAAQLVPGCAAALHDLVIAGEDSAGWFMLSQPLP